MNAAAQARSNIKAIAQLVKGLIALDEALDEAGSIEKMAAASQATVDELNRQKIAAASELAASQEALAAAQTQAKQIIAESSASADEQRRTAAEVAKKANDAMSAAQDNVASILASAKAEGGRLIEQMKNDKSGELAGLLSQIDQAKFDLSAMQSAAADAQRLRDAFNAELAALKQKFS